MEEKRKIRVLVVDDSVMFRVLLQKNLSLDPNIDVIATAVDPYDAKDKILKFQPDVITCDIEMPRMSGLDFVLNLMKNYPIPVVVISSVSKAALDALNVGAVDFVEKAMMHSQQDIKQFIAEISDKIKYAAGIKLSTNNKILIQKAMVEIKDKNFNKKIIAIGASTGGTEAIYNILKRMPRQLPGIVIVQHIPQVFSRLFAERLDKQTHFRVKEAETGDYIIPGTVLIAPGDKHMKVVRVDNQYKVVCITGDKVSGHCPSVDVLFESVASNVGNKAIGVILTGMGADGAKGLLSMRTSGSRTVGQDEASSVVYGMPRQAFLIGAVEKQVSLDKIPEMICNLL